MSMTAIKMESNGKARNLLGNLCYAFSAQGVSLVLSALMSLAVPKVLGAEEFGYWQLFLFYSSFVGFFHLGLNDGVYLRYGGTEYERLDSALIGSQFRVSFVMQASFAACAFIFAALFVHDPARVFVLCASGVYMLALNSGEYFGLVFQAVNRTKLYSKSIMSGKAFFIICVCLLLALKESRFETFVVLFVVSQTLTFAYCCAKGKKLLLARPVALGTALREMAANISIGLNLMLSNIAGILVLGVGRFVTDSLWGVAEFGRFSFALSLANFFLLFAGQMGMVLFPALRKTDERRLPELYAVERDALSVMLSGVLLFYLPVKYLISLWLPQYRESLLYLALLLPLCVFDGRMQLLGATYLKVMRRERTLLALNLSTLALSAALCFAGGYLLHSVYAVVVSMVTAVAFRSVASEIFLSRLMRLPAAGSILSECLLAAVFVLCTFFISPVIGFFAYCCIYIIYLALSKSRIKAAADSLKLIFSSDGKRVSLKEAATDDPVF